MKKTYKLFLVTIALIGFNSGIKAQTTVPNLISSNQVWNAAGSPYQITGNTLIEEGYTVTIMPGVTITSPSEYYKIYVDGQLQAWGTKDSVIVFQKSIVSFSAKSFDYDSASGTGSQFHYCLFDFSGSNGTAKPIDLTETSMLVKNCKFEGAYYGIYSSNFKEVVRIYMENSVFIGSTMNGYPVFISGIKVLLRVADCHFYNVGSLSIGEHTTLLRNTFDGFAYSRGFLTNNNYQTLYVECNVFKNGKSILELGNPAKTAQIYIANNTFDSNDIHINATNNVLGIASFVVENNNFLTYKTNSVKFGGSNSPGKADTLNFENNYWGSTTSSSIASGIRDYTDDVMVGILVNHSNPLSAMVTTCNDGSTLGEGDTSDTHSSVFGVRKSRGKLEVYPNPANNQVIIQLGGEIISEIAVFDITGKVVYQMEVNEGVAMIDVANLNNGIYVIQVRGNDVTVQKQLLVTH